MCAHKNTHRQRNNNKNNCPSVRGTRNLQVNFGGSIKKRLNATEHLVISPTPYGYSLFITKKRKSLKRQPIVGAHRCVRTKNTQAKRSDGGDEDKRTKKAGTLGLPQKKVLLHDENDETPRKNDLRALPLCNPPAL